MLEQNSYAKKNQKTIKQADLVLINSNRDFVKKTMLEVQCSFC